MFNPVLNLRH